LELLNTIFPFLISVLIGALIGIDREKKKQTAKNLSSIGIRTSIFISLLGAVSAYLGQEFHPAIFIVTFIILFLLITTSHIYLIIRHHRIGITTEISSLLLFLYGAMCTAGNVRLAIILAIITALVLATRVYLHDVAKNISADELYDTIKFAIIAFIILPFLPNESYDTQIFGSWLPVISGTETTHNIDVINPYQIWLLVVFISGISFAGYILVKILGNRSGISLTGFLGGLYSSTATSLTLANKSKKMPGIMKPFLAGILLACATSYIKTFIFIRALNETLFYKTLLPISLMFIYLLLAGLYFAVKTPKKEKKHNKETTIGFKTPFSLKNALSLTAFILAALIIAKISLSYAGIELYYLVAILSAFFAIDDPIIVSTAATAGSLIDYSNAKNIILLVIYLNMAQKAGIVYLFGNKKLFKPLAIVFAGLLLVTGVGFLYL
jgi:uncharacterized membrane protein (DUF4010 family)